MDGWSRRRPSIRPPSDVKGERGPGPPLDVPFLQACARAGCACSRPYGMVSGCRPLAAGAPLAARGPPQRSSRRVPCKVLGPGQAPGPPPSRGWAKPCCDETLLATWGREEWIVAARRRPPVKAQARPRAWACQREDSVCRRGAAPGASRPRVL